MENRDVDFLGIPADIENLFGVVLCSVVVDFETEPFGTAELGRIVRDVSVPTTFVLL